MFCNTKEVTTLCHMNAQFLSKESAHHPLTISFVWVVVLMRWMSIDYYNHVHVKYLPLFSSVDECGFLLFLLSDEQFQRYVWN